MNEKNSNFRLSRAYLFGAILNIVIYFILDHDTDLIGIMTITMLGFATVIARRPNHLFGSREGGRDQTWSDNGQHRRRLVDDHHRARLRADRKRQHGTTTRHLQRRRLRNPHRLRQLRRMVTANCRNSGPAWTTTLTAWSSK